MTDVSNIDDLLMTGKTGTQPEAPEHQIDVQEPETVEDYGVEDLEANALPETTESQGETNLDKEIDNESDSQSQIDDYGNAREPENKAIRERLERQAKRHQAEMEALRQQLTAHQSQQVQQASKSFEYNPEESGDWQQQLEAFVEQTVSRMSSKQAEQQQRMREQEAAQAFQEKFTSGMDRFADFREVVSNQPFTDPMTQALRGIHDPAAFVYAASKRHPQELERIAKIPDSFAQMVEIGKLEERMKKASSHSNAPRPISQTPGDAGMKTAEKKSEPTIEDMIAQAEARKLAKMKARRG